MKLRHLFLAAIVALGMMACNNEEVPQVNSGEGNLSVKVMPVSHGASSRLTGDLDGSGILPPELAAESAVKLTQVWVFSGNSLNGYGEAAAAEVTGIDVNVGPRDIYIIVNGGALNLAKLTSKAEIEEAVASVPVNIDANGLVMTAEKITKTLVAGKNTIGYGSNPTDGTSLQDAPVKVARVNARVAIVSAKLDLPADQLNIFDELKEVEVAMFNVNEKASIFNPNAASTAGKWLYGAAWPQTANTYENGANSEANTAFIEGDTTAYTMPIEIANAPYFYVNPLETENKMFIVLRGKAFKGNTPVVAEGLYTDDKGYTYYPVWVNGKDLGYAYTGDNTNTGKVLRNTQYNISLTIKKIGNPTIDPVEEAFLDVLVAVEDWKVVNQNVIWN